MENLFSAFVGHCTQHITRIQIPRGANVAELSAVNGKLAASMSAAFCRMEPNSVEKFCVKNRVRRERVAAVAAAKHSAARRKS